MTAYVVDCEECDYREVVTDNPAPGIEWDSRSAAQGAADGHRADTSHSVSIEEAPPRGRR